MCSAPKFHWQVLVGVLVPVVIFFLVWAAGALVTVRRHRRAKVILRDTELQSRGGAFSMLPRPDDARPAPQIELPASTGAAAQLTALSSIPVTRDDRFFTSVTSDDISFTPVTPNDRYRD